MQLMIIRMIIQTIIQMIIQMVIQMFTQMVIQIIIQMTIQMIIRSWSEPSSHHPGSPGAAWVHTGTPRRIQGHY